MAFDVDWSKPPGERITGLPPGRGIADYQALPVVPAPRHQLRTRVPTVAESAELGQHLAQQLAAHQADIDRIRAGLRQEVRAAIAHLEALDRQDGST